MARPFRVEFSKDHDAYLYKYLARYCPSKEGRSGRRVFQRLVANEYKIWPWCDHHTWQSWRERYVKNADHFDALILSYQRKHNIKPTERRKRAAEPMPIEMLGRSAKRAKLEKEERANSSEMRTVHGAATQHASPNSSMPKPVSKRPREPPEAPSQVHPASEPEPTDVRPPSPPHFTNDTNTDATRDPSLDLPALQTRHDALEIPSSSNQPASPPTDGEPEPRSPPRVVKRKKRPRASSEVFASESPSPSRVPAAVDDGGTPVAGTVYPHAPPHVVNSLRGQVLVDRRGHVPRAFPHEENGAEEVEEDKARWPPRRRNAKQRTTNGPDVEVDPHHVFSQPQPQPWTESPPESVSVGKRERGKLHQPPDGAPPDRRTAAALFSAGLRHGAIPQAKSEQREDMTRNGAISVERIAPTAPTAPTAPPTIPPSDLVPNSATKAPKYPAPRASTQSPFRSSPARETRHPTPRKAARHPALSRIRRQTIAYESDNGRAREHLQVPSVDLVTLSRSSSSIRSHSSSSGEASVPARPSRWSLPGAPSVPGPVLGSPLRWAAPPLMHTDILGRARSSSLGEGSTPRFMFTPSPVHSIAALATNTSTPPSHTNVIPASPSLFIVPHPPDIPITASHGLASILAHMSANHGLALGVVEAVYARVGSLREADEVLRGMREAAEEFGERVIEKRVKSRHEKRLRNGKGPRGSNGAGQGEKGMERQVDGNGDGNENGVEWDRTLLRYVAASEDGEGSEYFPPETSRAAVWKEQLESPDYAEGEEGGNEDGKGGKEDEKDEEQEEECAVEERLLEVEGVSENMEAQEQEGKVGRRQFHKVIVRQFV